MRFAAVKMRRQTSWLTRVLCVLLALAVAGGALPDIAAAPETKAQEETTEPLGVDVIVMLDEGADPVAEARDLGVEPTQIYTEVFTGFAATIPEEEIATALADRQINRIVEDGKIYAEEQQIATGVLRAGVPHEAGSSHLAIVSPIDADIAILDTGVSGQGDINVVGGTSCVKKDKDKKNNNKEKHKKKKHKGNGGHKHKHKHKKNKSHPWKDNNGHGSHSAGIAAAIDNNQGVVGVAPGARVWGVKVLNGNGIGSFSTLICGLDWVMKKKDAIDVVNLSLSGEGNESSCNGSALHKAVCEVVNAGIPIVVAAGNQGQDAGTRVPGSYDEVITVSGFADSDGEPGGDGPNCAREVDDRFLDFSNFGADIDMAAPGNCILSLSKKGKLQTLSGTSEAAPHVTGAAADYIAWYTAENGVRPTAEQTKTWLVEEGSQPQNSEFGITGDPDGIPEPVLWLALLDDLP